MKHKPFGELSRDEKLALMTAWVDGKQIEYYNYRCKWAEPVDCRPTWHHNNIYRIKPDTPDSIDWSHVSPEYKWMARNPCGLAQLFRDKPWVDPSCESWMVEEYYHNTRRGQCASVFSSYQQGTVDWKDSLVERPA